MVLQANPFTRVYQVLVRMEKARVAAALDDLDEVFAILREAGKLIDHLPRSALRCLVDAAAARCHLEAGQVREAEELIVTLPDGGPAHTLLRARWDLARGRFDAVRARLGRASPVTMRDRLAGELLLAGRPSNRVRMPRGIWRSRSGWRRLSTWSGSSWTKKPGGGRPGRGQGGIARDRIRHCFVGGAGFPFLLPRRIRQPAVILTERELLVLRFLPSHLTDAEIARECLMSVNTVKAHLKNIYAKLGVSSRAETVERARLLGLL